MPARNQSVKARPGRRKRGGRGQSEWFIQRRHAVLLESSTDGPVAPSSPSGPSGTSCGDDLGHHLPPPPAPFNLRIPYPRLNFGSFGIKAVQQDRLLLRWVATESSPTIDSPILY